MKNLAVFFGGKSTEHDVSIITALQTISAIDKDKYNVFAIYVTHQGEMLCVKNLSKLNIKMFEKNLNFKQFYKVISSFGDGNLYIKKCNKLKLLAHIDVGLNAFHGGDGENGNFSGFCECVGFPITCGNPLSMALSMKKEWTKKVCESVGLKVLNYLLLSKPKSEEEWQGLIKNVEEKFWYPLVVKPSSQGSSIGVACVENRAELFDALEVAFEFDDLVIVEQKVEFLREFNCSVIGSSKLKKVFVSKVEEPLNKNQILSFADKYLKGGKSAKGGLKDGMASQKRKFPADIDKKLSNQIQTMANRAFMLFELSGVVRIDFLFDSQKELLYLNEINTIPGSLAFYFWERFFGSKRDFFDFLIETAEEEYRTFKTKKVVYESEILGKKN